MVSLIISLVISFILTCSTWILNVIIGVDEVMLHSHRPRQCVFKQPFSISFSVSFWALHTKCSSVKRAKPGQILTN